MPHTEPTTPEDILAMVNEDGLVGVAGLRSDRLVDICISRGWLVFHDSYTLPDSSDDGVRVLYRLTAAGREQLAFIRQLGCQKKPTGIVKGITPT